MARIRTIKPEFWKHEDLSALPEVVHLAAAALLNYADDEGFFNANPLLVKAEIFPIREPSVSIPEIFRRLQEIGYIDLGTGDDGKKYGRIRNFAAHQRISHPTASKIANKSIAWENSANPPEIFRSPPESFRPERKGTGNREGKGKEQENYAFSGSVVRLTEKDFDRWRKAYPNLNLTAELQALDDYYSSNGVTDWFSRASAALAKRNRTAKRTPDDSEIYKAVM